MARHQDDTRDLDVGGPEHAVVLGDLDPGKLSFPVLALAPPGCRTEADPKRRLAARLDALAAWPSLAMATVHVVALRPPRLTLGLGRMGGGAELEVDAPTLSRRHGELGRGGDDRWFVVDFDSSNGTFVEDQRLLPNVPAALESGDLLRLGQHAVIFLKPDALRELLRRPPPAPRPPDERPAAGPAAPVKVDLGPAGVTLRSFADKLAASGQRIGAIATPFLLQVPTEDTPGPDADADAADARKDRATRPIPMEQLRRLRRGQGLGGARLHAIQGVRVVIGRGAGCDVLLPSEASASRTHAALTAGASGWTVSDLDSRNGTFVNGRRVPPGASLPVRDEFQLWFGGYRAIFLSATQLERLLAGA